MFSNYDVFVLIILLMSATLATYRGLVRELFSFISWVGAAVLTFIFYPIAGELLKDTLKSNVVVSMLAVTVTYFSLFFGLSAISALILDFSRNIRGGPLDRSAGLMFGVFRGLLIVSLLHYCVTQVQGGAPAWLEKSEFFKLSSGGAKLVGALIDDYVEASGERFGLKAKTDADAPPVGEEEETPAPEEEGDAKISPQEREVQQRIDHFGKRLKDASDKTILKSE